MSQTLIFIWQKIKYCPIENQFEKTVKVKNDLKACLGSTPNTAKPKKLRVACGTISIIRTNV
jgi:hypothetical protein